MGLNELGPVSEAVGSRNGHGAGPCSTGRE